MRRRLSLLVDRPELPAGTRIRMVGGDPADELMRLAEEDDAALIVVGSAQDMLARTLASAGVGAVCHVGSGPPSQALERCAASHAAGTILVGSQGLSRVGSVLLGSVSIQLAANARRLVMVLPPGAQVAPHSGHYEVAV